nr:hypothetical protein [Hungatella effluvii]
MPNRHVKMVRYYDVYAKHHKQKLSRNNDPLRYPEYGTSMLVLEVYPQKCTI